MANTDAQTNLTSEVATVRAGDLHSDVTAVGKFEEPVSVRTTVCELPSLPLHELDTPMAMRLLRFEVSLEERGALTDPRLPVARALRSLLLRAAGFAAGELAGEAVSFESRVAHLVRRTYAWAFRVLDGVIEDEPGRPYPRSAEQLMVNVLEACEVRLTFDPVLVALRKTLHEMRQAIACLSQPPKIGGPSDDSP